MLIGEKETAGVIGMGTIGSRVAERLRGAGLHVYVWSRTPRPVPNFVASPAEMVALTRQIHVFVTGGDDLLEIVDSMKEGLSEQHVVINHSTVSLDATLRAGDELRLLGVPFLDCPFTGSRDAAATGNLVYYAGGEEELVERLEPVLKLTGREVIRAGGVGDATVVKLATNAFAAASMQGLAEAIGICVAEDIPISQLATILEAHALGSPLVKMKLETLADGDFDPHFSLGNMLKDAGYAMEIADQMAMRLPALEAVSEAMAELDESGRGSQDFSVLAARYLPDHEDPEGGDSASGESEEIDQGAGRNRVVISLDGDVAVEVGDPADEGGGAERHAAGT